VEGLADDDHTHYATLPGDRPGFPVQGTNPTPVASRIFVRTTSPEKMFIYNSTDARWYAMETILLDFNRGSTIADTNWLGRHRINAMSSSSRGSKFPFKVQIFSMAIQSTTVPAATCSVDLSIGGVDQHTISWDGAANYIQEDINEIAAADTAIRAQVNVTGTAPANAWCILLCREYI
jgi:hypothetical protein